MSEGKLANAASLAHASGYEGYKIRVLKLLLASFSPTREHLRKNRHWCRQLWIVPAKLVQRRPLIPPPSTVPASAGGRATGENLSPQNSVLAKLTRPLDRGCLFLSQSGSEFLVCDHHVTTPAAQPHGFVLQTIQFGSPSARWLLTASEEVSYLARFSRSPRAFGYAHGF